MFFSEALLAKTGPLGDVWLAANVERKLNKQNILSADLDDKVKTIVGDGKPPLALRLSGQLLLGVATIYGRKAKYLHTDCGDVLNKIKVAFRPGNVDLPSNQSNIANPMHLILPDAVTELDLFAPMPDPEELFREQDERRTHGQDTTLLPDFGTSQLLPDSQTPHRQEKRTIDLDDDGLVFDIGLDLDEQPLRATPMIGDRSIEVGRRAESVRPDETTFLDGDDGLVLDYGLGDTTVEAAGAVPDLEEGRDVTMQDVNDALGVPVMDDAMDYSAANAAALARVEDAAQRRLRDDESELSSIRSSVERDLERTFLLDQDGTMEEDDPTIIQAAQRVKRRRVMAQDSETQLSRAEIVRQQKDRSAILQQPTFLPRDALLLHLMEMQRNGTFVSNIMGEGRLEGLAPELRGIVSLEFVKKAGEKKRKRDSGVADVGTDEERQTTPQLLIPEQQDEGIHIGDGIADFGADTTRTSLGAEMPLMSDPQREDDELYASQSPAPAFDITEAPGLHPSQSGPVSLGTKTAVHLLREHFAPDHPVDSREPPSPSRRTKNEALFTDLCPERTTTREDATKMFFEMLVLGTKDAIKVEQDTKEMAMPIRVRGKRGLWGDWAEMGAAAGSQTPPQVAA